MIKKLASAFLWFCTATLLAQVCILGLSYLRGNLTDKSLTQMVALMNGIDIPGERLKNAITAARDIPVPTREEILVAKNESSLELDSREKSLERWQRQLITEQARLDTEDQRLSVRLTDFEDEMKRFKKGRESESLNEVQKILELLAPEQAKDQILRMMADSAVEDVLLIIKAMAEDKRKKILAEFASNDELLKLAEILKLLRSSEETSVSDGPAGKAPETAPGNQGAQVSPLIRQLGGDSSLLTFQTCIPETVPKIVPGGAIEWLQQRAQIWGVPIPFRYRNELWEALRLTVSALG